MFSLLLTQLDIAYDKINGELKEEKNLSEFIPGNIKTIYSAILYKQ